MISTWITHDLTMEIYRFPRDNLWLTYWLPHVSHSFTYGFHRFPCGIHWFPVGFPFGNQWFSLGFHWVPMGCQWFTYGGPLSTNVLPMTSLLISVWGSWVSSRIPLPHLRISLAHIKGIHWFPNSFLRLPVLICLVSIVKVTCVLKKFINAI